MKKEDLIERYECLYDKMKASDNVRDMKIFGKAEKQVFRELAGAHPEMAERWVNRLEAVEWDNYLSQDEAATIGRHMVNQDGTKGFHWDYNAFCSALKPLGGVVEDKPHYNSYALWAVANMMYSDHAKSTAEDMGYKTALEVPRERMVQSMYRKALESLRDADGGFDVRDYFRHRMYETQPA